MQHTLVTKNEVQKMEILSPLKASLQTIYPEKEGWKLYNRYSWANKCYDLILQKESNDGLVRVVVCVNFENFITRTHFSNLSKLAKRLNHGTSTILKKILIIDDLAKMDKVPQDVEIMQVSDLIKDTTLTHKPKLVA